METGDRTIDSDEMKTPRRKRLGERFADGGFFADWLRDRIPEAEKREKTVEDDDEDGAESAPGKRYSRWQRLGAKLFGLRGLVSKEAVESATSETATAEPGKLFSVETTSTDSNNAVETSDDRIESPADRLGVADDISVISGAKGPESEGSTPASAEPEVMSDPEASAEEADDDEDIVLPTAAGGAGRGSGTGRGGSGGRRSGLPPRSPGTPPPGRRATVPPGAGGLPPSPATTPGLAAEAGRLPERIVVQQKERLAALALLATGAEYIGRRRADARQERRFNKKLATAAKTSQEAQQNLKAEVDRLARRNREEARQLEAREQQFEMQLRDRPRVKEVAPLLAAERQQRPMAERRPEQPASLALTEQRPDLSARQERMTEALLQKTETLVKQPLEKLYEQRHEVKDNDAVAAAAQAAGGGVLQDSQQAATRQVSAASTGSDAHPVRRLSDEELRQYQPELYKRAMTMGLWAALMIVIFGVIIYLVAR